MHKHRVVSREYRSFFFSENRENVYLYLGNVYVCVIKRFRMSQVYIFDESIERYSASLSRREVIILKGVVNQNALLESFQTDTTSKIYT